MGADCFKSASVDSEPIYVDFKDIHDITIRDIPLYVNFEIVDVLGKNSYGARLEGIFTIEEDKINVHMYHNWYRKYWDYPLGLKYHMDLMKRLLEFRCEYFKDTSEVEFDDEGDWCHLYYDFSIQKSENDTLYNVFQEALNKYNWVEEQVYNAQERMFKLLKDITEEYNVYKLVNVPDLFNMMVKEINPQVKGSMLEELVAKILSNIEGFSIQKRVRTETEEIDLVIRNQSEDITWSKESPLILVECKNWSSKIGKNEYVLFREKLKNRNSRAKVGILVSWNGFAATINKEDLRNSKDEIVIICLDKNHIKKMIDDGKYKKQLTEYYFDAIC
jgi:Holliday junction resolvase-like predicted endonuclease